MPDEQGYRPPTTSTSSGSGSSGGGGGPAPYVVPNDPKSKWSADLLKRLGYPITASNVKFINAWQQGEGTRAAFNPLATTQGMAGDSYFNSFGDHDQYHVRNYSSYESGMDATVKTLKNGRYGAILSGLSSGTKSAADIARSASANLNTWGTGGQAVLGILGAGGGAGGASAALNGGGGSYGGGADGGNVNPHLTGSDLNDYQLDKAMIKAVPELWRLWQDAIAGDWQSDKFGRMLRNTNWFKNHDSAQRSALYLQKSDPAEYEKQLADKILAVKNAAAAGGAQMTGEQIRKIAERALTGGWDDNQLNATLSHYIEYSAGSLTGSAGETEDYLRKYAADMGVRVGDNWVMKQAQHLFAGTASLEQSKDYIQRLAVSSFPGLKDQIANGMSVRDAASPYLSGMSSILEVNPESVDLFDPTIRKALTSTDANGKSVLTPLWQFESQLKKDPRWLQTNNARDDLMSTTHGLLQSWGLSV